jgi:arsenate reductase (glutaredoxin)
MKKIYFLGSCSTCVRIMKDLGVGDSWEQQDIKTEKITTSQIDEMYSLSGSYDALFSRRAMKYKSMGLKERGLSESDCKALILEEYTFLKRPVIILDDKIFIGNSKQVVISVQEKLNA